MKILIADLPKAQNRNIDYEIDMLKEAFPDVETVVYDYDPEKKEEFKELLKDSDALLSALIMMDKEMFDCAEKLKILSLTSTGFNFVDLEEAAAHQVAVAAVGEYCTEEVAEHTMALMLALNRRLKQYTEKVEVEHRWVSKDVGAIHSLSSQKLGIMGLGKIGRAVAVRAQAFGMKVYGYDPYLPKEVADGIGVELVDVKFIQENCDIITSHMAQTKELENFFNEEFFSGLKKAPIFINAARGASVDEDALLKALDKGLVRGAGLDVFKDENPKLEGNPFLNRNNVIITPHCGFYSQESVVLCQKVSTENMIHYLKGEYDQVNRLVNEVRN
ncbi:MAG: NAD(P)-dependent oxidoreductase [Lachnospiraceae bacterium]|nr:NAD(P)-dependent oxidoreductase [Lachnospiraceae bacterium]